MRFSAIAVLSSATFLAAAVQADTLSLPHQKLGLWKQVVTIRGKNTADQICLDAPAESKLSALSAQISNKTCQSAQITHGLDGSWNIVSTCSPVAGMKTVNHIVVTGDFSSTFRAVVDSTMSGSPVAAMNGTHKTIVTSTWLGPCLPGQRGGDVIMSNGMKVNLMGSVTR